jgi:branched-chain amino acid transport system permease protein
VFHVAIGAQILAGAYAAVYVSRAVNSFTLSTFAGICTSIVLSVAIMQVHASLQHRETSNSLRLIASLGMYFMAAGIAAICFGPDIKRGVVSLGSSLQVGSFLVSATDLRYVAALLVVSVVLLSLVKSPAGNGIAAVGSNRRLYAALGHNERRINTIVHMVTGAIAGLCGAFEGLRNGVEPYGYLPLVMSAAVAALLGGRSILLGPIVAGLVLGCLKSFTTQVLSDAWVDTMVFGILVVAVCFCPRIVLAPAAEEKRP